MLQPFSAVESPGENNTSDRPVRKHSDPYSHRAKSHYTDQKYTQAESACPHCTAGCNHGKFCISCCSHAICRDKRHNPYKRFYNRDPHYHMETHLRTLRFHTAENRNWFRQCKNNHTARSHNDLSNHAKLFDVINCLILPVSSQTLTYNCHQSDSDSDTTDSVQILQNVRHCLRSDCCCSKC